MKCCDKLRKYVWQSRDNQQRLLAIAHTLGVQYTCTNSECVLQDINIHLDNMKPKWVGASGHQWHDGNRSND